MVNWSWHPFSTLSSNQIYDILRLRQDVFMLEQSCLYSDIDYLDQQSLHLMGIKNEKLIAYLRFLPPGTLYQNDASFGRLSVALSERRLGFGKQIVQFFLSYFDENFPDTSLLINAQSYLKKFYANFGFQIAGEEFNDSGIMHWPMRRHLKRLS